jgi:hypothetical protein
MDISNDGNKVYNRKTKKYVDKESKIGKEIVKDQEKINNMINFLHGKTHDVSGPVSLKSLRIDELDKTIHIFGDVHKSNEKMCNEYGIFIGDFIKIYMTCNKYNILSKYPIDFFIESDYQYYLRENQSTYSDNPHIEKMDYPLESIIKMFKNCGYYSNKSKCEFSPNEARTHFSDVRRLIKIPIDRVEVEGKMQTYLLKVGVEKYIDTIYEICFMLMKHPKIIKQLNNIPNQKIARYFIEECEKDLLSIKNYLISRYKNNVYSVDNKMYISDSRLIRILLITDIFNLYNLARMFRVFKDKSECNRIILYSGNAHSYKIFEIIMNCKLFKTQIIQSVGLKIPTNNDFGVNRCLNNVKSLF